MKQPISSRWPSASAGFTMMEMVMVITILGVLAAVTASYWPKDFGTKSGGNQLVTDIDYTRTLAVSTGVLHTIQRDPVNASLYRIFLTSDAAHPVAERILDNTLISPEFSITFAGRLGAPSWFGTITLTPKGGDPQNAKKIIVEANTGFAWVAP